MPDLGSSTNASVKSYQLVKVLSGGRAPEKVQFVYCVDFYNLYLIILSMGQTLVAACLLLACCLLLAAACCCLLLLAAACCCLLLLAAACCCCFLLLLLLLLLPPAAVAAVVAVAAAAASSKSCCCFLLLLLFLLRCCCQLKWSNLASEAHGELRDKPYRLTSYRPRIGPRINAPLSTTVFDMQPFCPNLTCESGVPVWIKTHCAWDSGRSSLEKQSSRGDLLKSVWAGLKHQ